MASRVVRAIEHYESTTRRRDRSELTDAQLLGLFVEQRDRAAIEVLVRRHGPTVWGVCRRLLGNHHDAEDAFQATFLVLARKAATVVPREMLAGWLHGVAHRTALRAASAKRRGRERQVSVMPEREATASESARDLESVLDHELARLPEKYRAAIVLCDLEGRSHAEAARQLGWPVGSLSGRLWRARKLLAERLARHGIALPAAALGAALSRATACRPPATLISATTESVAGVAAGNAACVTSGAAALADGIVKSMLLTKLGAQAAGAVITAVCICLGFGALHHVASAAEERPGKAAETAASASAVELEADEEVEAPEIDPLARSVDEAVSMSRRRYLDGRVHTPWQIMHGILAYGGKYEIRVQGQLVNAVGWISDRPHLRGEWWWERTEDGGRGRGYTAPFVFEDHPNQFAAILAESGFPESHELEVAGGAITIGDIVRDARGNVSINEDVRWTLLLLLAYLPPDAEWTDRKGEAWSIERLVRIQLDQIDPYDAPRGGIAGLHSLSRARNAYLATGRSLQGVWADADREIAGYAKRVKAMQNPDGTFSARYFRDRSLADDFRTRLDTSGRTLEFLAVALSPEELKEDWVRRGVAAVADDLNRHRSDPMECGALYHAVRGLSLYRERTGGATRR